MSHFLVVEDNHTNLDLVTYLFKSFGHTYAIALDGKEALDLLQKAKFDLVVCDLQLPGIDGYGVVKQARASGHSLPIVAVSSFAMVGDKEKAIEAGFDAYIAKPIDPQTFVSQLESVLSKTQEKK
jgi:CheY-like chemotaxis protein